MLSVCPAPSSKAPLRHQPTFERQPIARGVVYGDRGWQLLVKLDCERRRRAVSRTVAIGRGPHPHPQPNPRRCSQRNFSSEGDTCGSVIAAEGCEKPPWAQRSRVGRMCCCCPPSVGDKSSLWLVWMCWTKRCGLFCIQPNIKRGWRGGLLHAASFDALEASSTLGASGLLHPCTVTQTLNQTRAGRRQTRPAFASSGSGTSCTPPAAPPWPSRRGPPSAGACWPDRRPPPGGPRPLSAAPPPPAAAACARSRPGRSRRALAAAGRSHRPRFRTPCRVMDRVVSTGQGGRWMLTVEGGAAVPFADHKMPRRLQHTWKEAPFKHSTPPHPTPPDPAPARTSSAAGRSPAPTGWARAGSPAPSLRWSSSAPPGWPGSCAQRDGARARAPPRARGRLQARLRFSLFGAGLYCHKRGMRGQGGVEGGGWGGRAIEGNGRALPVQTGCWVSHAEAPADRPRPLLLLFLCTDAPTHPPTHRPIKASSSHAPVNTTTLPPGATNALTWGLLMTANSHLRLFMWSW